METVCVSSIIIMHIIIIFDAKAMCFHDTKKNWVTESAKFISLFL